MPGEEPMDLASVYRYPRYYAIGYQWNTKAECDFLEASLASFYLPEDRVADGAPSDRHSLRLLDIGCGAGRHLLEMADRGYATVGFDLRPEMVDYVREQVRAKPTTGSVRVSVGDLRDMDLTGTYDAAVCLMDTFRFLLTNEQIIRHFKEVAAHLAPGGLYITDFWVPLRWDQIANEIYQWEQTEGDTIVRVFYVQHPESVDPVEQTFEDELVFAIDEGGASQEVRGGRTRTRLIMPQEFRALVDASGVFRTLGLFAEFDLHKPLDPASGNWRMVSVLKKTG